MLLQRTVQAKLGQAARATASHHQADGGAVLNACQAFHVTLQRGPNVNVAGHRAARQPGLGAHGPLEIGRVQQHQYFPGLGATGAAHQALYFGGVKRG